MRRTRSSMKKFKAEKIIGDDSSNDVARLEYDIKPANIKPKVNADKCDLSESSSESDIETCPGPTKELNLSSSFFVTKHTSHARDYNFSAIEADIFSGINRLSDSDSEIETTQVPIEIQNFKDIELYNAKLNDAKKSVEKYEARKRPGSASLDINNLLAVGEKVDGENQKEYAQSSDSYSDEQEDWEEIKNEKLEDFQNEASIKDVEITVEMPGRIAKKKGVDLMASIKRRINRVKKEQQVYVHKVHLLCWLAHGNYINTVLNRESVQALALSLLPSQHCYPSSRLDLSYLEQILTWYRKTVNYIEQKSNKPMPLEKSLQFQIHQKEASSKTIFVYIFICILRSLGINVRLVLNLLVEPLRPPNSELCSVGKNPSTESKDLKTISEASTSALRNKKCLAIPSTSTIKEKPVTPASKLCKLINNSDSVTVSPPKAKLMSDENTRTDSVPLKRKANVGRQSQAKNATKKSNEQSLSTFKEKSNSTVKNIKYAGEKSNEKVNTSEICSSSVKKLSDIDFSKDINSLSKSSKKDNKLKINKRLSEKSVNIFPSTRSHVDEGITTKKQSPTIECETVDLTKKLQVKSKSRKQLAGEGNAITNEKKKTSTSSLKLNNEGESKKHASKRTSSSNIEKGRNLRSGKKRKETVIQLDGPNSSTDESDYNDFRCYNNSLFAIPQVDGNDNSESEKKSKPNLKKLSLRSLPSKSEGYKKGENASLKALQNSNEQTTATKKSISSSSQSSYFSSPDTKGQKKSTNVRSDIINLVKKSISQEKQKRKSERQRKAKSFEARVESDSDSDFVPMSAEIKKPRNDYLAPQIKVKRRVLPRKELDKRVLNDEENDEMKKKGIDIWVEIFLEAEEKWISVDVLKGQVHCVKEIYSRASHPTSYILSWDNCNYIKDVTKRYCTTNWNTVTRKLRVEPEWWSQTLKPFEGPKTAKQREEDEELEQQQMEQPLPKAVSEYKNHPLYVLKRHLLKFEAIYPADAPALGFIRNEAVYSRMCVHNLHSREIWVKHAKVVRLGETAYKIVKARPKYDRYSNTFITDQPLEIFGSWQVDDYIPPTAENGIVPKNAYGNVELFKKCMLPKATVHIDLPGLQKVARKLNIDCPPAVIGFDFHGGWSHPTFEGFVVCEEFADILTAAWDQEQGEAEKRGQEKMDKRIYGNWRKLIKGLLIRERLQKRYDFGQPSTSGKKKPKLVLKKNRLCSDSDSN